MSQQEPKQDSDSGMQASGEAPIVTSLDELSEVTILVTIPHPDGHKIRVPMTALSNDKVWAIRRQTKWPKPPQVDAQRVNGKIVPVYNEQDETYQHALEDANLGQNYRLLLASLQIAIPGETDEEKLDNLRRRLGQWALNYLLSACERIHVPQLSEVVDMALSFQRDGRSGATGDARPRPDAEAVAAGDAGGAGGDAGDGLSSSAGPPGAAG